MSFERVLLLLPPRQPLRPTFIHMLETREALRLLEDKIVGWLKALVHMLPNLVVAALIVVAAWMLARLVRNLAMRVVRRVVQHETLRGFISTAIFLTILMVGVFAALSLLHLDKAVTTVLAGAGIVGLAIGFAFQDIAANFISGILMAVNRPIRVGELIETGDKMGVVKHIDLRTTEITSLQGLQVVIPNKDIFQNVLVNYTRNGLRRVDLEVGVSYGDDLEKVERVTLEAVRSIAGREEEREVELFFQGFGDSSIDLKVRFWVHATTQKEFLAMQHQAVKAVKAAYDREEITIPFPIRTLDFGIKGGEKLEAMLQRNGRSTEGPA
jgi:small conductance mechanosensitive channel